MQEPPFEVILALVALVQVLVHALVRFGDWIFGKGKTDKIDSLGSHIAKLIERDDRRQKMVEEMIAVHRAQDRKIDELYDMHKQTNIDGRPVWWFPPQMLELAKEQLDELREIANTQKEAAIIMKSITRDLAQLKGGRRSSVAPVDD